MSLTDPVSGVAVIDADTASDRSYVDWPAILAGTVFATAISVLLLTFGSAIGLSLTSPYSGEGVSVGWLAIAAGLWLLWVHITGFFGGAYLAGRMRRRFHDSKPHETDVRDGSHGLIVWALGTLVGGFIAVSGISGAVSTATNAAATVAAGTVTAGAVAATDDSAGGAYDMLVDRLFRTATPGEVPATTRAEVGRIAVASFANGELTADDRTYLISVVAAAAKVDEATATQRVDQLTTEAKAAVEKAKAAAEKARKFSVLVAFITAASLLVSAAAAYFAANLGGKHRDEGTDFPDWYRIR